METQLNKYKEVLYGTYGSNLSRDRFTVYLRGGNPDGSDQVYPPNPGGTELPKDDVFFKSDYWTVAFAGRSTTWLRDPRDHESGGGMAFLMRREGVSPAPCAARFRAYRIKLEQFVGVVRAENTPRKEMDQGHLSEVPELQAVLDGGDLSLSPEQDLPSLNGKNYPRLIWLGMLEGWPVLTFTCSHLPEPNPPTPAYAGTILTGLLHSHLRDDPDWQFPHLKIPLPRSRRVVVRESPYMVMRESRYLDYQVQ